MVPLCSCLSCFPVVSLYLIILSLYLIYKIFVTRLSFCSPFVEHLVRGILKLIKELRYYGEDNYPQPNHLTQNDNQAILELGTSLILVLIHKEIFSFIWKKLWGLWTQQHSLGSHAFSRVFCLPIQDARGLILAPIVLLFLFLSHLTAETSS